ncbi:insulinase family protein [Archangium minus]|uniref:Insulinase family protein n=1 Tax=Archangium minus TaxID=83450 RepID=A0ABY9WTF4_9BACT|nr:insulinase family protein [Archangium minus]
MSLTPPAFVLRATRLLLLLLAPAAFAAPFEVETFRPSPQHPLLLLAPREANRSTLTIVFDAGAIEENFENGLTRMSQHALLHANARATYEKLALAFYKSAATLELRTGLHESRFTLTAPPSQFDALARTLLTSVLSPKLDLKRFKATVERTQRDPQPVDQDNWVEMLLARALLEDQRYRDENLGSVEKLEELEPQKLRQYVTTWLAPSNATIIATGHFDAKALRTLVAGFKGGTPHKLEQAKLSLPFKRDVPSDREVQVFAYPVRIETARHAAAARVLASLMEERLYNRFRNAGVGYGFASEIVLTPAIDVFALILPASERSGLDLARFLREEVQAVREGKLEPGSFERHRQGMLRRLQLADTDPALVAEQLRLTRHRPAWYGADLPAALEALTPESLGELASSWLRNESSIQIHFTIPRPPPRETIELDPVPENR